MAKPADVQALFNKLFGSIKLGLYHTDANGNCLCSTGSKPAHLSGPNQSDSPLFLLTDEHQHLLATWSTSLSSGTNWSQELTYLDSDGAYRRILATAGPLYNEADDLVGFLVCNTDVTQRVTDREQLALSDDRNRLAIEAARAGVWDLDVLDNRCYFSPAFLQILGYEQNGIYSDLGYWEEMIHPDDLPLVRKAKKECLEGSQSGFDIELRMKTREGTWKHFQCSGKVRRDLSGGARRVAGTLIDISEKKKVELMLRMERDLMDLITTASPVGIVFIEKSGNIAFVNPCAERILGLSREQMVERGYHIPVCHLVATGDASKPGDELPLIEVLQNGGGLPYTCLPVRRADGVRVLLSVNAAPFHDLDGEAGGTVVIMEDVTEQKQHEQVVADGDRLLRETQKMARLGSYVLDLAKDQWACSNTLSEILDLDETTPMTLLGHLEMVHPEYREKFIDCYLASVVESKPFEMEYPIRRYHDGVERWVAEYCELKADDAGRPCRLVGMIHDITERKEAEDAIRNLNDDLDRRVMERTSQLAAAKREIESFSYSVSHDLRAPLRHINSFCAMLMEDLGSALPEEARYCLDRIQTASTRMAKLIDDLLTLTQVGRTKMKRERFNLSKVAAEVAGMLQETEEGCAAEFIIEQGLTAQGDSMLIRLVLQNLLGNALKYSAGKKARIEFGRTKIGGKAAFFVRDDGVGFDMAYANNLFQPFQRLHGAEFEGTGIGLATVKRIIERHGGIVWAQGKEMEGATFYFTLNRPSAAVHTAPDAAK
ncbi:MAG TPA: PAS domain S-box protein [Geomonas sp.]|nr:PAS domain S-box protein [Geomonas sp.]